MNPAGLHQRLLDNGHYAGEEAEGFKSTLTPAPVTGFPLENAVFTNDLATDLVAMVMNVKAKYSWRRVHGHAHA